MTMQKAYDKFCVTQKETSTSPPAFDLLMFQGGGQNLMSVVDIGVGKKTQSGSRRGTGEFEKVASLLW